MRSLTRTLRREPADKDEAAVKAGAPKAPKRAAPPATARPAVRFQFFKDVWSELKKVTWPTREEVTRLTILVSGVSVAVGAFLGLLDLTFTELVRFILSLGR